MASETIEAGTDAAMADHAAPLATHATTQAGHDAGHETLLGLDSYGWVGLAFLTFLIILWRVGAFRMLGNMLDAQAEKVKSDLAEAAALKAEAQAMKAQALADAAQAETDAKAIIANAQAEAKRILEQADRDAETAIARRSRLAQDRIAAEARTAEQELRARAADITVKAAQAVLSARSDSLTGLTDAAIATLDQR